MNDVLAALAAAIGRDRVLTDTDSREAKRMDHWSVSHLRAYRNEPMPLCAAVLRPDSAADVQAIVRICAAHGAPIVPFGEGSGVCGGVVGVPGAMLLDMGAMNRVRNIDAIDLLAAFDAGVNGLAAEQAVAAEGLTIGHWPQSIAISTVGGWVATRAAGQFSTAYGNIEDIVYDIEAVLPDGSLVRLGHAPRAAAGPDLRHLLLGSEGTLGIVTGVTLRLRRAAAARAPAAYYAPDMERGFAAQRDIIQSGWLPPVMRQYDAPEVRRNFRAHSRDDDALLLVLHEGPEGHVAAEHAAVADIAARAGLTAADPAVVGEWLEHRNTVPHWQDLIERGVIADTVEISAPWSRIGAIYRDAVAELSAIEGMANASAHSSHVYRSGINLYFTFAALCDGTAGMEALYFEAWDRIMRVTAAHGGGIAHHHGIGRLRKSYLHHDLGAEGLALLRRLKSAIDPAGIMNPGTLYPDA